MEGEKIFGSQDFKFFKVNLMRGILRPRQYHIYLNVGSNITRHDVDYHTDLSLIAKMF